MHSMKYAGVKCYRSYSNVFSKIKFISKIHVVSQIYVTENLPIIINISCYFYYEISCGREIADN